MKVRVSPSGPERNVSAALDFRSYELSAGGGNLNNFGAAPGEASFHDADLVEFVVANEEYNFTGFDAPRVGQNHIFTFYTRPTAGTGSINILFEDANSDPENRIALPQLAAEPTIVTQNCPVTLMYNTSLERWMIIAAPWFTD
jgi:hypothetical protein